MNLLHRRALLGLCAGVCALAFPAVAGAAVNPQLTLTPTTTPTAGAADYSLGWNLHFAPTTTDTAKSLTVGFPSGLLSDSTINNDQCLVSFSTNAACLVGSGTTDLTGVGSGIPAFEYLEPAPNPATDAAGVGLFINTGSGLTQVGNTADVTVRPNDSGLNVAFTGLPAVPQVTDLNLTLTHLRLPSSCAAASMTVAAVNQESTTENATSNAITPTGCPSQAYHPQVAAHVTNLGGGSAEVLANISQASTEAASKTIELDLPSSLSPSTADIGCLTGAPCVVGTASANTPLAPSAALAHGTVTLEGPLTAPKMVVSFPAPYALSFTGLINLSTGAVTVNNVPDVPITSLSLDIKNSQFGSAFTTTCAPSDIGTKFTGQGGQTSSAQVPISYTGCGGSTTSTPTVGKPMVTGSLSGLGARQPVLTLHVKHGSNAPNISSVSISLSSGLNFNSKGIVKHKHCSGSGTHRKCTVTFTARGLTISGASLKSVKLSSGRLVITLRPAGQATFTVRGPVLAETKSLQKKVKHNKVKHIPVTVKTVDGKGHTASTTLQLKA